ncbi:hypothetical protein BDV95DRAFT_311883 [Massariosphaeria phaeospora]|uniref:Uncharacterized protein n=1 Tax=Massariosphaeria phaeospora TaxID=100035 RepID=A0A7C8IB47_9PLEO|nr:hypothetical protein BDV95DRAFT_311883 [Massariosphaeria phaeospora]
MRVITSQHAVRLAPDNRHPMEHSEHVPTHQLCPMVKVALLTHSTASRATAAWKPVERAQVGEARVSMSMQSICTRPVLLLSSFLVSAIIACFRMQTVRYRQRYIYLSGGSSAADYCMFSTLSVYRCRLRCWDFSLPKPTVTRLFVFLEWTRYSWTGLRID